MSSSDTCRQSAIASGAGDSISKLPSDVSLQSLRRLSKKTLRRMQDSQPSAFVPTVNCARASMARRQVSLTSNSSSAGEPDSAFPLSTSIKDRSPFELKRSQRRGPGGAFYTALSVHQRRDEKLVHRTVIGRL